jgi:CheY-like chemotaxis protein
MRAPPATPPAPVHIERPPLAEAPAAAAPAHIAAPTPPTAVGAAAPAAVPSAPLLLVDDSAVVRAKLRKLFEAAGHRVVLARDGREALALLAQDRFALMVTDLEMPELDGIGLITALQAQTPPLAMPILAITGHDNLQERLAQLPSIQGLYRKPWVDSELLERVRVLTAQPRPLALH